MPLSLSRVPRAQQWDSLIEAHAGKCPLTEDERRLMLHCGNLRL
jgi:hypothetical protein